MNKWRPEGWKNPCEGAWKNCEQQYPGGIPLAYQILQDVGFEQGFGAGADAMLDALEKKSAFMTPEQMKLLAPDRKYPYGYLVFIPEQKEKEER